MQTAPTATRLYSHQERMRVVSGILLCILLAAIDQTVVLPAVPAIGQDLHATHALSWIVSAYLLTSTATTPIYGKLSDQLGRRAVLGPAILLFVGASILCALPQTLPQLIAARALQGLGGGGLMAIAQAAIADVIPPRERGKYQGWFAGVWGFASVAGPIIGGLVTQHASWRWLFWANVPLGAVAFVLCQRGLAGLPVAGGRKSIDWMGAMVLTAAVSFLLYALSERALLPGVIGALGLLLLPRIERRVPEPLFPPRLFTSASFRGLVTIGFLNVAALFAGIFLLPLDFQELSGATPAGAGLDIVPFLGASAAGAYTAGQLVRRSGKTRRLMTGGLVVAAAGFVILAILPAEATTLRIIVAGILGAGTGFVQLTSLVSVQNEAPPRDVGAATGTLLLLRAMGGALGATIAGTALSLHMAAPATGFRLGYLAAALALAIGIGIALRMKELTLRDTLEPAAVSAE